MTTKTIKASAPKGYSIPTKPPRTEAEARAQIEVFIQRDRKLLERLAKR